MKRFHARIFAPALDHQLRVQPIAIEYLNKHGKIHPKATWNDQSFFGNLMGVLAETNINVVLTFLPIINAEEFNERRHLAEFAENQIRDVILSSQTL